MYNANNVPSRKDIREAMALVLRGCGGGEESYEEVQHVLKSKKRPRHVFLKERVSLKERILLKERVSPKGRE